MEIKGVVCNKCGTKAFEDEADFSMWAIIHITIPGMRLERRAHFCPPCFTVWNKEMEPGPSRLIDAELEKALLQDHKAWPGPEPVAVTTGEQPIVSTKGRKHG